MRPERCAGQSQRRRSQRWRLDEDEPRRQRETGERVSQLRRRGEALRWRRARIGGARCKRNRRGDEESEEESSACPLLSPETYRDSHAPGVRAPRTQETAAMQRCDMRAAHLLLLAGCSTSPTPPPAAPPPLAPPPPGAPVNPALPPVACGPKTCGAAEYCEIRCTCCGTMADKSKLSAEYTCRPLPSACTSSLCSCGVQGLCNDKARSVNVPCA